VIQTLFGLPGYDPYHALAALLPGGRTSVLREIDRALLDAGRGRIDFIDTASLAAKHSDIWDDPVQWSSAKIYPASPALPILAEQMLSYIRAHLGLSRKVLAVDLDNTLWGGVVGEEGLGGIKLGPPSALGERYQTLQRYLLSLKQRGILLAVVSKNNPDDAAAVFRQHRECALALQDFAAFEVTWNDKTESLRRVSSALGLGLDSFVFLDDNPAERARVRSVLREVAVPEISGEPSQSIAALERGLYFQATRLNEEDLARAESYRARARTLDARAAYASVPEYLASLEMEIAEEPVNPANCARVAQLINKTNQFNLTTKRYTEEQVRACMSSGRWWLRSFRLRDRFADHGLIGVLLVEKTDESWRVDTWLLSCRVIGRGVEKFMFNTLLEAALAGGAPALAAEYLPSPKNTPVKKLLPDLGFRPSAAGIYFLDPRSAAPADCPYLRCAGTRPVAA
jgi:FkbH-like protein